MKVAYEYKTGENQQGRGNGGEYVGSTNVELNVKPDFCGEGKRRLGCINRNAVCKIRFWLT